SFSVMPRHPPSPTLFPYTTLFRSAAAPARPAQAAGSTPPAPPPQTPPPPPAARFPAGRWRSGSGRSRPPSARRRTPPAFSSATRSEEHTSELQSRENLVCRLLLEK